MTGTKEGGRKAAATNKLIYGEDFYARIGAKGGSRSTPYGGFGSKKIGPDGLTGLQRASIVGVKGGHISRRNEAQQWYEKNKFNLEALEESGYSNSEIAHKLGISVNKLYYINKTYRGRL